METNISRTLKQGAMRPDDEQGRRLPDGFLAPPALSSPPRRKPPAGATDVHAHVFGPFDRFPLAPDRPYTPHELPGARYLAMLDQIGFARGVLVQGAAHGLDCGAMLNALDLSGTRLRGVALATIATSDNALSDMNARSVRGLRFMRPPRDLGQSPVGVEAFSAMAPRIKALGWHAQIQTDYKHFVELADECLAWSFPIVLDHMGLIDAEALDGAALSRLLALVREGGVWVKLTVYRASRRRRDFDDMRRFHDALVAANPDRMLWGSDWPHVHMRANMPEVGRLVDLLSDWIDDEDVLRKILVDNPAQLYGF